MTDLQKVRLELSESREALNELAVKPEPSADDLTKLGELRTKHTGLEKRYRELLESAETPERREHENEGGATTPEQREFAELEDAVTGGDFLLGGGAVGQPAEYRQALGLAERCLPWGSLLTPEEKIQLRADVYSTPPASGEQVNQTAILAKLMEMGISNYLHINTPSVPMGTASYPHVSGAATAQAVNKGAEVDASDVTVGAKELKPKRVSARVGWALEDEYAYPGFAEALTMEARRVLMEKLDSLPLKGQDANPEIEGLSRTLAAPVAPTAASAYKDLAQLFVASPPWSYDFNGVRLVTHRDMIHYLVGVVSARGDLLWDPLDQTDPRLGSRVRVTNFVDAPDPTTKVGELLRVAGPTARGRCVMPVWANLEVADDMTRARTGQRLRTLIALTNVGVVDATPWTREALKTT